MMMTILITLKLDNDNYRFEGKPPLKDVYKIIELEDTSILNPTKEKRKPSPDLFWKSPVDSQGLEVK